MLSSVPFVRNKAKRRYPVVGSRLEDRSTDYAKRSQFLRSAMAPEDEMCKTKPICWSQMRKTNPIPGGAGRDGARGAWDEVQMRKTNPISDYAGGRGLGGGGHGAIMRNKAN